MGTVKAAMNPSKVNFILLAVLFLLLVVGALGLNSLINSSLLRKEVQKKLAHSLRMEVQFENFRPSLFGATRLEQFTATSDSGDSLSARQIVVQLQLLQLLRGRVSFSSTEVADLRFVRMERETAQSQDAALQNSDVHSNDTNDSNKTNHKNWSPNYFGKITVTNASLDWLRADGRSLLQLTGVDLSLQPTNKEKQEGKLHVKQCTLLDAVALTSLETSLIFENNTLSSKAISAKCGGGSVDGAFALEVTGAKLFDLQLKGAGINLQEMSEELPGAKLSGLAEAEISLRGRGAERQSWEGRGAMEVKDGTMPRLQLLQSLGLALQIQELASLKLRQGSFRFRIGESTVWLDECRLDGGDILLAAPGRIDLGGTLNLNAQLTFPERFFNSKMGQLFGNRFTAPDAEGRRSMTFQVTGTMAHPKTDLMERVVGSGDLGKIVGGFLGGFLKPRKAEPAEATETKREEPNRPQ